MSEQISLCIYRAHSFVKIIKYGRFKHKVPKHPILQKGYLKHPMKHHVGQNNDQNPSKTPGSAAI